jgi:SAM-dependent methyltransferase
VSGLRLLHLQCHFGLDTLAWARAGARVTGLDFAPSAVAAARDIAQRAGLAERAEFVCADVYDAVGALGHAEFDIVYVSLGALCWLPSVERWAAQVGAMVAPGGRPLFLGRQPAGPARGPERGAVTSSPDEAAGNPTDGLDDIVHQRARLGILTIAHEAHRVEFGYLARNLGLTAGNLAQHLRVLEEAGLVRTDKVFEGRRPRTWVSITGPGRRALLDEVASLKAIVSRVEGVAAPAQPGAGTTATSPALGL